MVGRGKGTHVVDALDGVRGAADHGGNEVLRVGDGELVQRDGPLAMRLDEHDGRGGVDLEALIRRLAGGQGGAAVQREAVDPRGQLLDAEHRGAVELGGHLDVAAVDDPGSALGHGGCRGWGGSHTTDLSPASRCPP
ncbi:DUF3088 domain-containing protein [Babesia caballi]|uniref:DUF3088 domain-containing protein n=1 Tax=Babesia caballi TaxID=5871 RepID=A0AAV4LVP2_BABCB|nr:DUF3088 domain-containing protein [Babesia caballi]